MPKFQVTSPDGKSFEVNAPDGATQEQVLAYAQAQFQQPQAEPTLEQKVLASAPARLVKGMKDPIDALAQLAPRGLSLVSSLGGLNPNPVSRWLDSEASRVDKLNHEGNAQYETARSATGSDGVDLSRMAGNVLSPANAAVAARLPAAAATLGRAGVGALGGTVGDAMAALAARFPAAATTLGRAGVGALSGAVGGAMTPVDMKPGENFASAKAAQIGLGSVTGGILSPVLGKIADWVGQSFANRAASRPIGASEVENAIRKVAAESGLEFDHMEPALQQQLRGEAIKSLQATTGRVDQMAMLRKADFDAEGISPTAGQITRDAGQYAKERNLRTMAGVGDPLLQRFEQQGQQLQQKVGQYANGASENFAAGNKLANALKAKDDTLRAGVSQAYRAARESAGKDAEIPLGGLATDAADVLDRFGDKVPSGVLNQLKKYGMLPDQVDKAAPRKLFTVEAADDLIKTINANQSADPATNAALSQLRTSVKNAVTTDAGVEDVFAPARKAAAERFRLQDAVPALEAAATGSTAPDDFVKRFVVNGKTNDVKGLAALLKDSSPEAFNEAKAQVGKSLQKAAYGKDVVGDAPFTPKRFAEALDAMGTEKLRAFYSPEEVAQLRRLARIGAYINQMPNASPVQTSNNWGAIMTVAGRIPGVPAVVGLANAAKTTLGNQSAVTKALAAEVPKVNGKMTPEQISMVAKLFAGSGVVAGSAAAQPFK